MHISELMLLAFAAGVAVTLALNAATGRRKPTAAILAPPPAPGAFDEEKVREALRANDQRAVTEAYQRTFCGDQGRFVLAHFMAACGIGQRQGPGVPADDRHYFAGRQDTALELMNMAGFDQPSAVLATMTDTLEGQTHDRHYAATPRPAELDDY